MNTHRLADFDLDIMQVFFVYYFINIINCMKNYTYFFINFYCMRVPISIHFITAYIILMKGIII